MQSAFVLEMSSKSSREERLIGALRALTFAFDMSLKLSGSNGSRGSSGVAQLRYQCALQLGAARTAPSLAAWAALSACPSIGATFDLAGTFIAGFTKSNPGEHKHSEVSVFVRMPACSGGAHG